MTLLSLFRRLLDRNAADVDLAAADERSRVIAGDIADARSKLAGVDDRIDDWVDRENAALAEENASTGDSDSAGDSGPGGGDARHDGDRPINNDVPENGAETGEGRRSDREGRVG